MNEARLREVPIFKGLSKSDVGAIAQQSDELDVAEGKALTREGEFGHEFFVIESGTADVTRNGERVNQLGPGDFFGEMALLEEDRRTATVTATSPMNVIVMTRASFRAMERSMPRVNEAVTAAIQKHRAADQSSVS
jgi:CRP-like cAMP-binding protein